MKKIIITIIVIAAIVGLGYTYQQQETVSYSNSNTASSTPQKKSEHEKNIEKIMEREEFEQRMKLEAELIHWQEKKKEITEQYEKDMADIEANLENVREAETSF